MSISLDAAMDLLADPGANQAAGEFVADFFARSRSRTNSTERKDGVALLHSASTSPTFKSRKLTTAPHTDPVDRSALHDQLVDMTLQPTGNLLFRAKTTPGEGALGITGTTKKSRLLLNQLPLSSARQNGRASMRQLWSLLRQQVFLGMAASSVPVRSDVPNTMEDLSSAGIRFVYFSPRNMKRSKPVAEKIGLQFDWNCAISLRDLDEEQTHDPHRHISNYADWDVLGEFY
jgi:hypothetical protein